MIFVIKQTLFYKNRNDKPFAGLPFNIILQSPHAAARFYHVVFFINNPFLYFFFHCLHTTTR